MSVSTQVSIVLPVRNRQHDVTQRVENALQALAELTDESSEVVVVDDGSSDATPEVLNELGSRFSQVRVVRHSRPRGMEAAGQTGLERAKGELVFIQESNTHLRVDDLHRLHRMSRDYSVVAARAESTPRPIAPSLLRRLRLWGTNADQQFDQSEPEVEKSSMQMIRRTHLQKLAGPYGDDYRLQGETFLSTKVERV